MNHSSRIAVLYNIIGLKPEKLLGILQLNQDLSCCKLASGSGKLQFYAIGNHNILAPKIQIQDNLSVLRQFAILNRAKNDRDFFHIMS